MQTVLSPIVNVYQSQLDASHRCAEVIFSGTERIDRVILDATHRALNQQLNFMQAMASGGNPKNAMSVLQSNLISQGPMETMNSQKEIMEIFTEMQNAIGKSLQEYMARLNANPPGAAGAFQDTAQRSPDTPYNPVTGIFSVWESAFREAAALARKSLATTRSTMEEAAIASARNAAAFTAMPTHATEDASAAMQRTVDTGMSVDKNAAGMESGQDGDERRGSGATGKRK
jgi:hypothetical protein